MKTEKDINDILLNLETEESKYPSMTYEQGVQEALMWVLDEISDDEFKP